MIIKRPGRRSDAVRVKFSVLDRDAKTVHLAGDFTGWRPDRAMRRRRDGTWELTLDLAADRAYEFRYVIDGHQWINDPSADQYIANPFGGENSAVVT